MALFKLTFANLKDEAVHAISGDPDSRTSLDRIVNGALEYLVQMHPWSWRFTITNLDYVQDVAQLPLPADFGEMIELVGNAAKYTAVRPAPIQTIMKARAFGLLNALELLWYPGMATQTDPTEPPLRILEVAPTPAADLTDALMMSYSRLIPTLSADTDVPSIPYGFVEPLRTLVRAYAYSSTYQRPGHDWELFSQQIQQYIAADSLAQGPKIGQLPSALEPDWTDLFRSELPLFRTVIINQTGVS